MKYTSLLILILTLAIAGCGPKKADETENKENQSPAVHLTVEQQKLIDLKIEKANKAPFESRIQVIGEIAQETERAVHLTSPESGVLKTFLKEVGEAVQKDEPLFEVSTKNGQTIKIPAPDHGVILARYIKVGESVDNITSVMTIVNPDVLRASFNVYEKDIARVKLGQKVMVRSIAYPDKEFQGVVAFISPNVDEKSRTIKIRVNIDNKEDLLKFGMFVTGDVIETSAESVILAPSSSIVSVDDKPAVFVPFSEEDFVLKFVKIGRQSGDLTEIKEGLAENENVVTTGSFQLKSELLKSTFGED